MNDERKYLNILKGLLIVLVVVGHFGQTIANNLPDKFAFLGQGIILFIYAFHMPLFLFVSGYLSKNAEKQRGKAFGGLLIPYILFQLVLGIAELVLTKRSTILQNVFIPQMGAWYLLTLFSYRLVLPEVSKLRGVFLLGIVLTVFGCCFTGIGNEFALKKSIGFFVYFIAGYMTKEIPRNKIKKYISLPLLAVVAAMFVFAARLTDYSTALSILTHGLTTDDFDSWYIAPVIYAAAFVITAFICFLVVNAIPKKCASLENLGKDTMPMYLSHLAVFFAVGYLVPKDNWIVTVAISTACIVITLILFSRNWYKKLFNSTLQGVNRVIMPKKDNG